MHVHVLCRPLCFIHLLHTQMHSSQNVCLVLKQLDGHLKSACAVV